MLHTTLYFNHIIQFIDASITYLSLEVGQEKVLHGKNVVISDLKGRNAVLKKKVERC